MKRALAIVSLTLLAGGDFVKAPPGWTQDADATKWFTDKENKLSHFGGNAPALATVQVFKEPDGPGTLYVTGVAAKLTEHRDAAARVAVDEFLAAPERAQLTTKSLVSVQHTGTRLDDKAKHIEATLTWEDKDASATTYARLLVAADAENLIAVTGECLMLPKSSPAAVEACKTALASLDAGIATDKRVLLSLAPAGTAPPPGPARPSSMSAPTLSDGARTPMAPITLPPAEPKRTVDRRPVYVGAGLVVLAGLFWWNRRRRGRIEAGAVKKDTDE